MMPGVSGGALVQRLCACTNHIFHKEDITMIRLGGPVAGLLCNDDDPAALARAHVEAGYAAAYCPPVDPADADRVRAIREAFDKADVAIAEVGAWCNLHAADPDERKRNFEYVCRQLALADEVGARCCVDYIGSFEPGTQFAYHPDNLAEEGFDRCVETVRSVIDAVRPKHAKFCLETMQTLLPDSPDAYANLVEAINRPAFAVHLDPVNLVVSPRVYHDIPALLRHCFNMLGPMIVSCHAKDLVLREALALHIDEVRPGLGKMDYRVFLTLLRPLGDVPLMLEHLETAEEYTLAAAHIRATASAASVPLHPHCNMG
jgi:sugar phosphate isomerase/epimerase